MKQAQAASLCHCLCLCLLSCAFFGCSDDTTAGDARPVADLSDALPADAERDAPSIDGPTVDTRKDLVASDGADPGLDGSPEDATGDAGPDGSPGDAAGDGAPDGPDSDSAPDGPDSDSAPDGPDSDGTPDGPDSDGASDATAIEGAPLDAQTDSPAPDSAAPVTPAPKLVAGGMYHTCAVTPAGGVMCWGYNGDGQLGDGSGLNSRVAVDVPLLPSDVVGLASRGDHTCSLSTGGAMRCWGANTVGQLGTGSASSSPSYEPTPQDVVGHASGASDIATGGYYSCVVSGGGVMCWGANEVGQLGLSLPGPVLAPTSIPGLGDVVTISAGWAHTCVSTTTGGAKCWGFNLVGALGDGTSISSSTPRDVIYPKSNFVAVAVGEDFSCGLTAVGGVKCWGANSYGQLGNGGTSHTTTPKTVLGLSGLVIVAVVAGSDHACALAESGEVKCWGYNGDGQLGIGDISPHMEPFPKTVVGVSGATAIGAGQYHTCALLAGGGATCWGINDLGQTGTGLYDRQDSPLDHPTLGGALDIAFGPSHACVITAAGAIQCWGLNGTGQLGKGDFEDTMIPTAVSGITGGATALAPGKSFTCALVSGGATCWGLNSGGQLGTGDTTTSNTPRDVSGLGSGVTGICAGEGHACAIVGGAARCWGLNADGQLGTGGTTPADAPQDVPGLGAGVTAISAGREHTCAVVSGAAKCWGANSYGQLGTGDTTPADTPQDVPGLGSGVTAITAGDYHTCAIVNGAATCWGRNLAGQVGVGAISAYETSPRDVSGLDSGVTAIVAGKDHSCALAGGALKCWGSDTRGQLGAGAGGQSAPTDVPGLASGVSTIIAGGDHTAALTSGGALKVWGENKDGDLGLGYGRAIPTPTNVVGF